MRSIICRDCGKKCPISEQEDILANELRDMGIKVSQQKCDGHKHIDLVILSHRLNIEVDGGYHQTIKGRRSDYQRDNHSSWKGFDTIRVTNGDVDNDIDEVLDYIEEVMDDIDKEDKYDFY